MLSRQRDEQLAGLVAQGDQQAFAVLYERYHQQLDRYCRSILHHDVDAQDALQSAMTAALAALQRDRRLAPVRPWLYRIAHNEVISLLRRRRSVEDSARVTESLSASAEEEAGERARFAGLMADLAELPERQRAALLMRELSGLSHGEIAIALKTSEGAAKQAIFDARRALLEFAQGRAMECDGVRLAVSDGDGRVLRGRSMRAHLRDCASCQVFAASIPARRAELHAVVPLLAAPASANLLSRVLAAGSGNGAAAGAGATVGAGAPAAGVAGSEGGGSALITLGAGKAAATTIATKLAAGALIIGTGLAGVAAVTSLLPSPSKRTGVTTGHRAPDRGARRQATIVNHPGLAARGGTVSATRSAPGALGRGGATASGGGSTTTGGSSVIGGAAGTPLAGGGGAGPAAGTTGAAATGNGGGTGAAGSTSHGTTTITSGSGGSTGSTGSGTVSAPAHGHGHGHGRGQGHGSGGLGPPSSSTPGGSGKTSSGGAGGSGAGGSDGHGNSGHTGTTKPAPPNAGGSTKGAAGTQPVMTTTGTSTTEAKPHGK
jgi:RNA polymerase sigma factor (sigma-70 family)